MGIRDVRPGDVLLYAVSIREKGGQARYYACEVVGSLAEGRPLNLSGEPMAGVRAIYRRENATTSPPGRILLPRDENAPGEKSQLARDLAVAFGPGELIRGISCQCEAACCTPKKRL